MSEALVIEWDRGQLIAALGTPGRSNVELKSAFVVDRSEGLLPAELGEKLASSMSSAGITATEAIVVFPRELVTFHRIELPNLGDDELADMVKLQAATRLTVPIETVNLDFSPLPVTPGSSTRDVLLVTAPQKHVTEVKACLSACGLELSGLRVSSFGIGASVVHSGLLSKSAKSDNVEAFVSLGSDSIEMIFMTGHHVAFSHSGASWTSIDGVEQAVRAEISRARMAAAEDMGSYTVSRLTLIGSPEITQAVPDSVASRLNNAEVVRVDPEGSLLSCTLPEGHTASDMLAISGALANSQSTSVEAVDLVNPRKAPEKKDYGRLKVIVGVGAAALLLIGGWKWRDSQIKGYQAEADSLSSAAQSIEDDYKSKFAKAERTLANRIRDWSDRDINWLDEMQEIQSLMQSTERVYINRFEFGVAGRDHAGTISAEGNAKSRRDIEDLMRVLRDAGYEVSPSAITSNLRDPNYSMALTLEVSIPLSRKTAADKAKS